MRNTIISDMSKANTPSAPAINHTAAEQPPTTPRAWLEQWPPERRSTVANYFHYAVRSGHTSPTAVVQAVAAEVQKRLQWTIDQPRRQWLHEVLHAIRNDPDAARAYAETVLAWEQLPYAERQQQKSTRAAPFLEEAMRGKPTTSKQLGLLQSLGYSGPPPTDRAEASALIDRLLHGEVRG
jgi:hypothetical protein